MNHIVAAYLPSAIDIQRKMFTPTDSKKYIQEWYDSVTKLGLDGTILHDSLSKEFQNQFPKVLFTKVDVVPKGMQLYDYRWILFYEFVLRNPYDNFFFYRYK